jgi:hypothetical protein
MTEVAAKVPLSTHLALQGLLPMHGWFVIGDRVILHHRVDVENVEVVKREFQYRRHGYRTLVLGDHGSSRPCFTGLGRSGDLSDVLLPTNLGPYPGQ